MLSRRDVLLHLLEDAPISEAKRRRLYAEIYDAFVTEADPTQVVNAILRNLNLVDLPFIDLWNLIQVVPEALPLVWTDANFRVRTELEFNDVYRASLDPSGQMYSALQEELVAMTSKSATMLYRSAQETVLPWALLYQRCKRIAVLIKGIREQELVISLMDNQFIEPAMFASTLPANHVIEKKSANGNGEYLVVPVVVEIGRDITHFLVIKWTKPDTRTAPLAEGGSQERFVVLNVQDVDMERTRIDDPKRTDFVITHTGKIVYAVLHADGHYLEVLDSSTGKRVPGNNEAQITKAVEFSMAWTDENVDEDMLGIDLLEAMNNSSIVTFELTEGPTRIIDIETYVEYLENRRETVDYTSNAPTENLTASFYLQNGWKFEEQHTDDTQIPYRVLKKNGKVALGSLPVSTPASGAHGPFFSVSRGQPVLYTAYEKREYFTYPPGPENRIPESALGVEETIDSSIFVVQLLADGSFPVDEHRGLYVYHPTGASLRIRFAETFHRRRFPRMLAMVGSVLLLAFAPDNLTTRYYMLDLEQVFIAALPSVPRLIRAPCRVCSLPSLAHCGGAACRMPYCGLDCQKVDWEKHRKECEIK